MDARITRTVTVEIEPTPLELAVAFCEMDAELQAQFFVEVARIMRSWKEAGMQTHYIAERLRDRKDDGWDARELVRDLAASIGGV